jgi:hypothetical protein
MPYISNDPHYKSNHADGQIMSQFPCTNCMCLFMLYVRLNTTLQIGHVVVPLCKFLCRATDI